ncbi:MAG: hypothetical protein ACXWBQ_12980, partial [Usitatibacter sp.]
GAYYGKQADDARKVAGMEHLLKGAIVYRVDAAKCGDSTANQAVPILEGAIGSAEARERLKQDAALRARLVASALDYELATGDRPLPKWVCAHGLRAGSPTPDAATFQAHREAVRARYVAISAAPQQQSGTSR